MAIPESVESWRSVAAVQTFLGVSVLLWAKLFASLFAGILFTQSGLDKVFNYRENLDYHRDHFKNSPLAPLVGPLTLAITALETAAGLLSVVGAVLLFFGNEFVAMLSLWLSVADILCLFLGQRLAKDYAGAASLVAYFVALGGGLLLYAVG
jgi:hypothetical protein